MKKIILLLSAAFLLTGCSSEINNNENTTEEETMITQIDGKDFEHNYTAEELEEMFYGFVKNYYDGTKEADFDKCFADFPSFYMDMLEKEVAICKQTHEEYMQDILLDYKLNYGDDFDFTVEIAEDEQSTKGILCLSADSLNEIKAIIKETYDTDITVDEAYVVYADITTKGSVDTYNEQVKWFMLKIDGKMYLYEPYYETNPLQE